MGHDVDGHKNMHVDQGALPGEHPGKATDPIIKVRDIAWLEEVTAAAVRGPGLPVLAAGGLTLEEVGYPADTGLASRAEEARTVRTLTA